MSNVFTNRAKPAPQEIVTVDDQEELSDIPLTPREGWTSVIALSVMMASVGLAIDNSEWVGKVGTTQTSQTGFLPICGILAVLVGTLLAKSRLGRYTGHLVGASLGALFLLNAAAASVSIAPTLEGRLHALNLSVSTWVNEVVVLGIRSYETSVFLLIIGALVWGAGQFSAYAVFRRHRPLPAVVLTAFILLVNVCVTTQDQYLYLIAYMAAALVLLIRLNLLDQSREWRSRGMRDVADISQSFMRNGAAFVALAVVAAVTLAANASSAPLSRMWSNMDDNLLEIGYALNRVLGGVTGSARGPNALFSPTQTISGVWESSSQLVFTATSSEVGPQENYWRGATYDSFDGNTWRWTQRNSSLVDPGSSVMAPTAEAVADPNDKKHHNVQVIVTPEDYGGDVIVAPNQPFSATQQLEVQTNGASGAFNMAKLTAGIQPGVSYAVRSVVWDESGPDELTENELAAAGTDYPDWIQPYLAITPGSVGDLTSQTAQRIMNSVPAEQRDPYHLALATQFFLNKSGGFKYVTDVRGMCPNNGQMVDCFLQMKQGYCEYFASAMTMLLREMKVPTRYVLGYLPGQEQQDKTWRVERNAAHAWVEVYFPSYGWVQFDPTPGNVENGQRVTDLPTGGDVVDPAATIGAPNISPDIGECSDNPLDVSCKDASPSPEVLVPGSTNGSSDSGLTTLIAVTGIVLALAFMALLAVWRRVPSTEPELAYRGVTKLATRLGYGPRPSQTVYEYATGLGVLVPVAQEDLQLIATAKVEATYGRRQPADTVRLRLGGAYRRVRLGLLRTVMRRPHINLRPRAMRNRR